VLRYVPRADAARQALRTRAESTLPDVTERSA